MDRASRSRARRFCHRATDFKSFGIGITQSYEYEPVSQQLVDELVLTKWEMKFW